MSDDLKERALGGLSWSVAAQVIGQIVQFGVSVLLARLLMPEDFGLVGMVTVFTGFVVIFSNLGLGAALIQRKEVTQTQFSSIFWLNIALGLVLMLVVSGAAPVVAWFYSDQRLVLLTMLVAVQFPISSLNVVQNAILNRELDFRRLAYIEICGVVCGGAVGVAMALLGYGPYAIVWSSLVNRTIVVSLMWLTSPWRPSLRFDLAEVRELLSFGGNLVGFQVFNYWVRNADDLLVGRVLGSASLGIYTRAYSFMLMPIRQISGVISRVMFPTLSLIQDDRPRVKRIYLRLVSVIALISFPMMLGLLVVADVFILALIGEQWSEVIPLLRILCVVGLMQSIGHTVGWIYKSQGRVDIMFRWGIVSGVITLAAFAIGIRWGLMGITIAYLIRNFLLTYFNFTIPGRLIDLRFYEVVRTVASPLACAAIMAGFVWLIGWYVLPDATPVGLALIAQGGSGVAIYWALIHILRVEPYLKVREVVRERLAAGTAA